MTSKLRRGLHLLTVALKIPLKEVNYEMHHFSALVLEQ